MLGPRAEAATEVLARVLEGMTGQQLSPSRRWRVEASLAPVLRAHRLPSVDALVDRIAAAPKGALATQTVEALLNNETSFFRDAGVFDMLDRQVLDVLSSGNARTRRLRLWSAACSTGQEAYSLAMIVKDNQRRWAGWTVDILGTDVSGSAIERARGGRYSSFEIQRGLPVRTMLRWFEQEEQDWVALPELRRGVRFATHNLADEPPGVFDLILCRNVLLYLSPEHKRRVFDRLASALAPGGVLLLGAGETVIGLTDRFATHPDLRGAYIHAGEAHALRRLAS